MRRATEAVKAIRIGIGVFRDMGNTPNTANPHTIQHKSGQIELKMSDLRRGHKETIQCGILGHKLRLKLRSDLVGGLMNAGA